MQDRVPQCRIAYRNAGLRTAMQDCVRQWPEPAGAACPAGHAGGLSLEDIMTRLSIAVPARRVAVTLLAACATAAAGVVQAQSFPSKPVRFIVPFGAGSATDQLGRLLAENIAEAAKQPVIVENKAGGSGIPATEYGKAAAPDGYTLMVVSSGTFGVNPSLYPDLPYKPLTDFLPISNIFLVPLVIVAHPSLPVNTLAELIALAKKEPGKLSYASAGPGTSQHLSMELFKLKAGVDIVHIPYKGAAVATTDLLAGQIQLSFASAPGSMPYVQSGKLRALAVTGATRSPALPETPTVQETGLKGFEVTLWLAVFAPAKTPRPIVERLHREFAAALAIPQVRDALNLQGLQPESAAPAAFARHLSAEIAKWREVARKANLKPE